MNSICHLHLDNTLTIIQKIYHHPSRQQKPPLFLELLLSCMYEFISFYNLNFEQDVQVLALYKQRLIWMIQDLSGHSIKIRTSEWKMPIDVFQYKVSLELLLFKLKIKILAFFNAQTMHFTQHLTLKRLKRVNILG